MLSSAQIIRKRTHVLGERSFEIIAYFLEGDGTIFVEAYLNNDRAVYTYSDGLKTHLRQFIEPMTALSFKQAFDYSAIEFLMDDVGRMLDLWADDSGEIGANG